MKSMAQMFGGVFGIVDYAKAYLKGLQSAQAQTDALRSSKPMDHWRSAPFGTSKNSVAGNARRCRKMKAQRRARKLGHA